MLTVTRLLSNTYSCTRFVVKMASGSTFNAEVAIKNFQEYLRIKSVQPQPDYNGVCEFLKKMADQLSLTYQIHECVPGKPVFVMTWRGRNPSLPSVLLNSHTDVVPVFPEFWKCDPFSATIDEHGNIFARGSQDMKCVGMQYIEAIRKLKSEGISFDRTIHLSFVPDEEIGGHDGMQLYVTTDAFRALNIGFALDEGLASPNDVFNVYYAERCPWWVEFTCPGQPGHGSLFIQNNAGNKLRHVINSLLAFRDMQEARLKADPNLALGDLITVNLTQIEGGVQPNVVPSEFKSVFDIRLPPTTNLVEFEARLTAWCSEAGANVSFKFLQKNTDQCITSTSSDDPWWAAFSSTMQRLNLKVKTGIFPAATDSRYLRKVGCPAIGFSPMNNTLVLLHDHNEYLNSEVFVKGIDIYAALITSLAGVPPV